MMNLGVLNTIIAVVIVLLVLSLIVQSIQSLVKKLLKLKSTVFVSSMLDLFQYVESEKLLGQRPEVIVELVKEEFRKLGRETLRGRPMFDSISKEDLLKIVDRIVQNDPSIDKTKLDPKRIQQELEKWFETVMQGFNERYARHMKSVAVIIAFIVVVVLNANFFSVYRNIATSDALQARILAAGAQVQKQAAAANPASPQPSPNAPGGTTNQSDQQAKEDLKKSANEIQEYANEYKGFGFSPLKPQQIGDFVSARGVWQGASLSVRSAHAGKVLLGWLIMTLLLSAGAPFWQDALESLFGLKGLIRKKGETRNVEPGEGGQQKP
jgi:hypothetical protein